MLLCTVLLLVVSMEPADFSRSPYRIGQGVPGFVCKRMLSDGELERRVHWGRISAVETTVEIGQGSDDVQGLTLRQVTDGRHFIQLIYDAGWEMRDCEYLKDPEVVDEFFRAFTDEPGCVNHLLRKNGSASGCCRPASSLQPSENFTLELLSREHPLPPDLESLTDYRSLRQQCQSLHDRVKQALKHPPALKRLKRDIFLYPGTNWCGSGSNARKFNELGYNAAADRCCRDHDHCPHTIEGFTSKYNFFNFRFHTISHCDCDERFRACLKLSGTAAGNMIGRLFFNIVQTKCFLFKKENKCVKRSWWGKCLKHEKQKVAVLRDALSY